MDPDELARAAAAEVRRGRVGTGLTTRLLSAVRAEMRCGLRVPACDDAACDCRCHALPGGADGRAQDA